MDENINETNSKNKIQKKRKLKILFVVGFAILFYFLFVSYNNNDAIIHVKANQPVVLILQELKNKEVVRNDFAFKIFIKILGSRGIDQGDYLIKKNSSTFAVAWQLSRGRHNIKPTKITLREGLTNEEISTLLSGKLASFDKDSFLTKTKDQQGYLFPDTYFFFPLDTTDEIIEKMSNNFENRIRSIGSSLKESDKKFSEIIIMASILEGEAGGEKDIATISGILWKRISVGMPLQVDVDKSTYTTKGLPDKPLNNPGLTSIKASANPISSTYLYYLHDKNGEVHYAKTFEEHKCNISKYLK